MRLRRHQINQIDKVLSLHLLGIPTLSVVSEMQHASSDLGPRKWIAGTKQEIVVWIIMGRVWLYQWIAAAVGSKSLVKRKSGLAWCLQQSQILPHGRQSFNRENVSML
jgi:hypothetical protein